MVTFDQSLYIKAVELVLAAEECSVLKMVWVRLGGFHMLMPFLGSIGYIMGGSGLEELWNTIHAKNSIPSMLNGHTYSRSLRVHFLTQLALSLILLKNFKSNIDPHEGERLSQDDSDLSNPIAKNLLGSLSLSNEANQNRTGKLWCQYWRLVELI